MPAALVTPPADIQANVFGYAVCFVQNGQLGGARCSDRAQVRQPNLLFELQRTSAFTRAGGDFFLDLSLLQTGGTIEATNLTVSPFEITLEPDYSQLGGSTISPLLNQQAVVRGAVRDSDEPATEAEYVRIYFSVVPPREAQLAGNVHVIGSFNDWTASAENRMTWYPDVGRYEGSVLAKQGQYEYRYVSTDPGSTKQLNSSIPRQDQLFTAFVYYDDVSFQTDRLLSISGTRSVD